MTKTEVEARGRERVRRAATELVVIFVGVTAAFFVEGYREHLDQRAQLRQATEGIAAEMARYRVRGQEHADSIQFRVQRWRESYELGNRPNPAYYRIPGAPYPPTAAWDGTVASGVASMFEPALRVELGYFYNEYLGIHANYLRHLTFVEREVLPRVSVGSEAFYDGNQLRPEFLVQMSLLEEFGKDLSRLSRTAEEFEAELKHLLAAW